MAVEAEHDGGDEHVANVRFWSHYITDKFNSQIGDHLTEAEQEAGLKDLWRVTLGAAKRTSDAGEIWRLVAIVAGARARGALTRAATKSPDDVVGGRSAGIETCTASGKVVWTDMPFFEEAIEDVWTKGPSLLGAEAWNNVNDFAARLNSVGAMDLLSYGVRTVIDVMEVPRAVTKGSACEGGGGEMTVEDLLPAAVSWFRYGNISDHIRRRVSPFNNSERARTTKVQGPGPLAVQAGVTEDGFTLARYRFWRDRLRELSEVQGDRGESSALADAAVKGYKMVHSWRFRVGDVPCPDAEEELRRSEEEKLRQSDVSALIESYAARMRVL